jgi:cyclopropane fatty-acyl-phospholipid synthase-like methyltransferase
MSATPTPERILQLGMGFWASKALLSAVELEVFTALGHGPLDAGALRDRVGIHPRGARDLFDALVALGLLAREGERYANAPETAAFLDRRSPTYVGGLLEMANARLYEHWGRLTEALRTGRPQNEAGQALADGRDTFEEMYADPERMRSFVQAMTGVSLASSEAIARQFPWPDVRSFVDLGTAEGGLPVVLARAHPHLEGIGLDLPAVRPHFEAYVARHGLEARVRFVGADMFEDELPRADVMVLGHILHGVGLEAKRRLLARVHGALPRGGFVIVHEALIDDERSRNAFGLLMSLNMLIETQEGFDYTGADCRGWMEDAGFSDVRVEHLVGPDSMVVGRK